MKSEEKSTNQKGLRSLKSEDYGMVEIDGPDDILYRLTFDKNNRTLMINGKTFMRLKPDLGSEKVFLALFKKRGVPKRLILNKKEDAYYIIRNLGLPLQLRKAMFNTYQAGKKIEVYTEITRERAREFRLDYTEIMDFLHEKSDYYNRLIH